MGKVAVLSETIRTLEDQLARLRASYDEQGRKLTAAVDSEKQTRKQFDALKERIVNTEIENQRMRGYIERVQEDDVAREELVAIGDPAGEQQLVPKRKPSKFSRGSDYSTLGGCDTSDVSYSQQRDRPKPRHWVTY